MTDAMLISGQATQPEATPDITQLLAALQGQPRHVKKTHLAQTLGWDLQRLDAARATLDTGLRSVSLTVRETPRGWKIALLEDIETRAIKSRFATSQSDLHGIDRPTARLLHDIVYREPERSAPKSGGRPPGRARFDRLTRLEGLGTITYQDARPAPSPSLRHALNLP